MADQEAKKAAKPAVVKKKKPSKPKTPAAHPTYNEMIRAAIVALAERSGSSRQAIQKYIFANYKVGDPQKARVHIKVGLKRMEASGLLKHTKGKGASGSFKLGENAKKPAKTKKAAAAAKKKPAAKKPAAKKPATKKKSPTKAKKPAAKKAAKKSAKKPKPEKKASKPKKAKSPAKKKSKSKSPSKKKSTKKAAKK